MIFFGKKIYKTCNRVLGHSNPYTHIYKISQIYNMHMIGLKFIL